MSTQVVIIDDVREEIATIEKAIGDEDGFSCIYGDWTKDEEKKTILEAIRQAPSCVVLLDLFFHGEERGEDIFRSIKRVNPEIPIFILTAKSEFSTFKKYSEMGAFAYINKNEPINSAINRIRLAAEEGVKYQAEFEQIERTYTARPENAIYELKVLLKRYTNIAAYKRHNELLKKYLERPFSHYRIPTTDILSMMQQNSELIVKEDPSDEENLAHLAVVLLHLGDKVQAMELFKSLFQSPHTSPAIVEQLISWLEKQYFGENYQSPDVEWLARQLIDNYTTDHEAHLHLIDILWSYNRHYWEEGIVKWLLLIEGTWQHDNKDKLAERVLELFSRFGIKEIKSAIAKRDPTESVRINRLCEEVFGHIISLEDIDNFGFYALGMFSLFKLIFDKKNFESLSEPDNKHYYKLLDSFLTSLCLLDDPVPEAITSVCGSMAKLRFTSSSEIQQILDHIKENQPTHWRQAFDGFFNHLRQANPEKLGILVNTNQERLLNILEPTSLIEVGRLLKEKTTLFSLSNTFYRRAVEIMFEGVTSEEDLYELRAIIDILKKSGTDLNEWKPLEEELERKIIQFGRSFKVWDGKSVAIMGGQTNEKDKYIDRLKSEFGGDYKWYAANKEDDQSPSLAHSLQNNSFNIVIIVTNNTTHKASNLITDKIKTINKHAGFQLIKPFLIDKKIETAKALAIAIRAQLDPST